MLLLLFRGSGTTPALGPDNRDASGLPNRNAAVSGLPNRNATVTALPNRNASVTGRPPNV